MLETETASVDSGLTHVPLVSVLLCTNVANEWLNDAIRSIIGQTFAQFELLIMANGVSDSVFQEIANRCSDPRVRLFRTSIQGITFSLNWGLHLSRAEIVARMDADDIAEPERLQTQFSYMQTHPHVMVCGSSYRLIDMQGVSVVSCRCASDDVAIRRALFFKNPICHPSVMFRRKEVLRVGGYAGNGSAEDYELWLTLRRKGGGEFVVLPEVLLNYRLVATGIARGAKTAYVHVAGARCREFFFSWDPRWLIGVFFALAKSVTARQL